MNSHKIQFMLEESTARFFTQTSQTSPAFCPHCLQEDMTSMSKSEIGVWHQQGMVLILVIMIEVWNAWGYNRARENLIINFQIC